MNKSISVTFPVTLASGCPDLLSLRTDTVVNSFDESLLAGHWYENAYEDIAQVGASCQVMENSIIDIGFQQDFSTKYGFVPFSQTYIYRTDALALYTKYLEGAEGTLTLPTVIVDVQLGADGMYSTMTEFTCKEEAGVQVTTELRFSSRSGRLDAATLQSMKDVAVSAGIPQSTVDSVQVVDHSKCKNEVTFLN